MTEHDDAAALIERAKEMVPALKESAEIWARSGEPAHNFIALNTCAKYITDLTDALERALADAARMRSALEAFVHYDSNPDDEGVTMMLDYARAIELARAALEPRLTQEKPQ